MKEGTDKERKVMQLTILPVHIMKACKGVEV
jgi:hypothetical protein